MTFIRLTSGKQIEFADLAHALYWLSRGKRLERLLMIITKEKTND